MKNFYYLYPTIHDRLIQNAYETKNVKELLSNAVVQGGNQP